MTIGQTSVPLSTILEHSFRRVGIPPEAQTPEILDTAKSNLFFILSNFANLGMNYWCLDQQFITLTQGKVAYTLPAGTIDVLNTNFRRVTTQTASVADVTTATTLVRQFAQSTSLVLVKINSTYVGNITVSHSPDGISYTQHSIIAHDGTSAWYTLDPVLTDVYVKLSVSTGTLTVVEFVTASAYTDVPMYRFNRDDYASLPNKTTQGTPLQFWFDRKLTPVINIWPTADANSVVNCIMYYRQRQPADIGALTETLDIPNRWLEAVIWNLSQSMAFELPNTPPDRVTLCSNMAQQKLSEAQMEERDNSTVQFSPEIGVYTS